jgi:hypothetical protein
MENERVKLRQVPASGAAPPHTTMGRLALKSGALYQAFPAEEARRVLRRLEFHYVPKHASWLNMVEIDVAMCFPSVERMAHANSFSTGERPRAPVMPWGLGRPSWWARCGPATERCPLQRPLTLDSQGEAPGVAAGSGACAARDRAAAVSQKLWKGARAVTARRSPRATASEDYAAYSVADFSDKLTNTGGMKAEDRGRCSAHFPNAAPAVNALRFACAARQKGTSGR